MSEVPVGMATTAKDDRLILRRTRVAELRKSGMSQQRIAAFLSIAVGTVNADLQVLRAEWQASNREDMDAAMWMDVERLDEMLSSVWIQAKKGSLAHVDRVLKILERRAHIFGYETQPDVSGVVDANPIRVIEVVRAYDDGGRMQKLIDAVSS